MTWEADEKRRYKEYQILESWRHEYHDHGDRRVRSLFVMGVLIASICMAVWGLMAYL